MLSTGNTDSFLGVVVVGGLIKNITSIQDFVLAILVIASITLVLRFAIVIIRTIKDKKSGVIALEGSNVEFK